MWVIVSGTSPYMQTLVFLPWRGAALHMREIVNIRVYFLFPVFFAALHGMHTRSSDENSVCLSVRPSVSLSNAWIVTKRKKSHCRFLYHTKDHLTWISEKNDWWGRPLLTIWINFFTVRTENLTKNWKTETAQREIIFCGHYRSIFNP